MRPFLLASLAAPLLAVLPFFGACVGSDAARQEPVDAAAADVLVEAATPMDTGPAVEDAGPKDAGPRVCAPTDPFTGYELVVQPQLQDVVGGRVVPGLGILYTLVGSQQTSSRLFLRPEDPAVSTNALEILVPGSSAPLSVADARPEGNGWRIVFAQGNYPLPPDFFGSRELRTGTLRVVAADTGPLPIANVAALPVTDEDMAEPQLTPDGVLFSARVVTGMGVDPRTIVLLRGALAGPAEPQRQPVFTVANARTSPFRTPDGALYFADLNDQGAVQATRALLPSGALVAVPLNPPTANAGPRYTGVTYVSPDHCAVYFNAPASPTNKRSALWVARR